MLIYVDGLRDAPWKWGKACHLFSEDDDEDSVALHVFAKGIGLKRSWFHDDRSPPFPHYDLTVSKRKLAIRKGAVVIDAKEYRRAQRLRQKL